LKNNRKWPAAQLQNASTAPKGQHHGGFIDIKEAVMSAEAAFTKRLIGLFLLGYLLLTHPLISLFDRPALVGGIPLLYVYIFGAWACIILLAALITRAASR
jgi:hypothetical protein